MSRGPNAARRTMLAAIEAEPARRFTVLDFVGLVWPGEPITHSHVVYVRRELKRLETSGQIKTDISSHHPRPLVKKKRSARKLLKAGRPLALLRNVNRVKVVLPGSPPAKPG